MVVLFIEYTSILEVLQFLEITGQNSHIATNLSIENLQLKIL
ncbi:hypothetical protein SAMN05216490_2377 [Mucilaginibacter mallensis]|uniref:Uncharacterized protein n=1 Tax=Mucilaginibacter mallensis TaxID=652787 RepID=A0A1H1X737_MUCMA|nr:hypothetical protein SAMN05216490_2377 [Mucilaginibacter mallensis]